MHSSEREDATWHRQKAVRYRGLGHTARSAYVQAHWRLLAREHDMLAALMEIGGEDQGRGFAS